MGKKNQDQRRAQKRKPFGGGTLIEEDNLTGENKRGRAITGQPGTGGLRGADLDGAIGKKSIEGIPKGEGGGGEKKQADSVSCEKSCQGSVVGPETF